MKIVIETEQSLTTPKGLPGRRGSAAFLLVLGALLVFVAPPLFPIICWVLAGLFALATILIPDTITVDQPRREIALRKPSYGLFPKTRIMPFSAVEAVQVGYRQTLGLASTDWQVTLLLADRAVIVTHSRNEHRMRQLGSAISGLVGVRFVSDTFRREGVSHDHIRLSRLIALAVIIAIVIIFEMYVVFPAIFQHVPFPFDRILVIITSLAELFILIEVFY